MQRTAASRHKRPFTQVPIFTVRQQKTKGHADITPHGLLRDCPPRLGRVPINPAASVTGDYVRFAPIATKFVRQRSMSRWANSRPRQTARADQLDATGGSRTTQITLG